MVLSLLQNLHVLKYDGVPALEKGYMFGDHKKKVVDSTTKLCTKLHKGHILLSNHYVREAVKLKMNSFTHINGSENPADILSKH